MKDIDQLEERTKTSSLGLYLKMCQDWKEHEAAFPGADGFFCFSLMTLTKLTASMLSMYKHAGVHEDYEKLAELIKSRVINDINRKGATND